jgi:outer membrane protein OmpA-like peptidoglycan-associated protein
MKKLLIGVSLLALLGPAAYAQQGSEPATTAVSGQIEPGKYRVFFTFNQATLTPNGARVVGEAAEEYKRTGAARIAVTGHTDLSGSPAYNQALSERRAEAVQGELVWLGVPASVIGEGENDPLVPTAEGVREARNRRVEIEIPQPTPALAPVAPAPIAVAPQAEPALAPR